MIHRVILSTLAVLVLLGFAAPSFAGGFDDVPAGHYAYNAVQYLYERGILKGDEWGKFNGEQVLTRYDFAIALARAISAIEETEAEENEEGEGADKGEITPDITAMVDVLKKEFQAELEEIKATLADHETRISTVESDVSTLKEDVGSLDKNVEDINKKLGKIRFSGDARLRFQRDTSGDKEAHRPRIRFRLKMEAPVNEQINFTGQLASGNNEDPTNTFQDLKDEFTRKPFWLDQAYLTWTPEMMKDWKVLCGKFPPTWQKSDVTMDANTNVEGASQNYKNEDGFVFNLAEMVPEEKGLYVIGQIGKEDLLTKGFELYCTYNFISSGAWDLIEMKMKDGDLKSNWNFNRIDSGNYSALDILGRYTWDTGSTPFKLTADYLKNLADEAVEGEDGYLDALWGRLDIGQVKEPSDFAFFAELGRIEANSVLSWISDSARGQGDCTFWAAGFLYRWLMNTDLQVLYVNGNRISKDSSFDTLRVEVQTAFK